MSDKKKQQQQQQRLEELERRHKASIQKRETLAAMITRIETEEHSLSVMLKEKRDELRRAGDPGATGSTMRNKSDKACGIVSSIKPYMFLVDDIPEISLVVGKEAAATRPNVQKSSIVGPANPNGVEHSTSDAIEDLVAACTVSTYPRMPGTDRRQGTPICDRYRAEVHGDRVFVAIGDGCGWGEKAMEAADRATEGFITHLIEASARVRDTKALGCTLLEAVAAGHNAIISGKSDVYSAGTTTLIGGTVFPLPISVVPTAISTVKPSSSSSSLSAAAAAADAGPLSNAPPGAEFGVCLASIGDCKCFRWDVATKRVHDITAESRGNTTDPSDPGGRLGPYTAEGLPDTRNLRLHYATCHTNDLLIFCSDGVHDNLDCASLGITPGTLADELDGMTWPEAARANRSATEKVRAAFYDARLDTLINEQYVREGPRPSLESPGASSSSAAKAAPTPADIADYIIEYCLRTTYPSRKYLETHPGLPLPQGDYRHYPGKMDHATVVVIRVDTPGN